MADMAAPDLVFVDESGVKTNLARLYGRAPRGQRAHGHVPHGHWKLLTVVGALTADGLLASMTVEAATDADVFRAYVAAVLAPALRPGHVVVLDNLSAHKAVGVRTLIEERGCRLVHLPPYSPDLNPIEMLWSKMKTRLRAAQLRKVATLERGVSDALATVTAQDAGGYFRHCGYTL